MLQKILDATGLTAHVCASLLGIDFGVFDSWASGQRPIPESMVGLLSSVLGVKPEVITFAGKHQKSVDPGDIMPAIWYKFRGTDFGNADRECALLMRHFGYCINELEEVTEKKSVGWHVLFEEIRRSTDLQAPPREQGRQAARMYSQSRGLAQGATGIGDVIRGNLRSMGVVVIETPFPDSTIEGCSFYVGLHETERPCVFANTYSTTWFRRNAILMHEVAHAIFDAENAGASLDIRNAPESLDLAEVRADAFAQEVLVPRESIRHLWQKAGANSAAVPTTLQMATIVAIAAAEQQLVIKAAIAAGLISSESAEDCRALDISSELPRLTKHALSTEEFIKVTPEASGWVGKRKTTIPSRGLLLPAPYIKSVLESYQGGDISLGKVAELLMVDEDTLHERFPEVFELAYE